MATQAVKNTHRQIFIDVSGGGETATYERLGEGVTDFTPSANPTVETKHYINASSPTHKISATERQYSFSADVIKGDPCLDYIASLDGKTGDEVDTYMIDVDASGTGTSGSYPAKRYAITISLEQPYSIEGGANQVMSGTFYANGDPVEGTFNTSTKTFTEKSA